MQRFAKLPVFFHKVGHFFFGDELTIDFDSFPEILVVGRGVQSRLEATGGEDCRQHMGNGALSIGARHVNAVELPFRVAEVFAKGPDVGEVLAEGRRPYAVEHGQVGVEVVQRLLVSR